MSNSGVDHENTAAIDQAAEWLASHPRYRINRPIVPLLKETFGLTAAEAIEAIRAGRPPSWEGRLNEVSRY